MENKYTEVEIMEEMENRNETCQNLSWLEELEEQGFFGKGLENETIS